MDRLVGWQHRFLAVAVAAALLCGGGVANAREGRATTTPPGYTGYDLTIASLRAHDNCSTSPVGKFRRDADQTIGQGLADDMKSSTLARVTAWNWDLHARRIRLQGTGSSPYLRVVYFHGSQNITEEVVAGTYRTPLLERGASFAIGMRVSMRHYVSNGNRKEFTVRAPGVRFTNSVIPGDHVQTQVVSVPYDVSVGC